MSGSEAKSSSITVSTHKIKRDSQSFFSSIAFRSFLIIVLLALMLVPLKMVQKLLEENNIHHASMLSEISKGWGENQTIIGPVLAVPYVEHLNSVETVTDSSGLTKTISRDVFNDKVMIILPEELNINAKLNERHRKQGRYDSLVYKADVELNGYFNLDVLPQENKRYSIRWKKSWLAIGLSDTKAINDSSPLRWENSSAKFEPGTRLLKLIPNGIHALMKNTKKGVERPSFKIQLSFNGKSKFRFAPIGESTVAQLESSWATPSFQGAILPRSKILSKEGFTAEWSIPYLSRNYPQSWLLNDENTYDLTELTTGVDLGSPPSVYSKVSQAANYGALFIGLTFLAFLIFEITVKSRIHIIQYALVGLSISLFYILLISLLERFSFQMAYLYSAGAILGIITLYTAFILKSLSKSMFILILLGSLYAAMYTILEIEEYALLVGAGVLLFIILLLMMATRSIDYDS